MDYKLHLLFQTGVDSEESPLVLDAGVTKAACLHDILLDVNLMTQLEVMTSPSRTFALFRHKMLCEEVLAAANHAISENQPLEVSVQIMTKLAATLTVQDK